MLFYMNTLNEIYSPTRYSKWGWFSVYQDCTLVTEGETILFTIQFYSVMEYAYNFNIVLTDITTRCSHIFWFCVAYCDTNVIL